jgi:hypothetical protein
MALSNYYDIVERKKTEKTMSFSKIMAGDLET